MIRRDYILRMIEEFMQTLSRIRALKKEQRWKEAGTKLDEEFERLVNGGIPALTQLSEIELLARLIQGDATPSVRDKTLMLTALLKEVGDVSAAQGLAEQSQTCYLKGLHLLLHSLAQGGAHEFPEFVPKVEVFVTALERSALPLQTLALLMQHYESIGEFAKAEDALFAMIEREPNKAGIIEFGISFYDRLQGKSDDSLHAGNLPRSEVEAGLAELQRKKERAQSQSA